MRIRLSASAVAAILLSAGAVSAQTVTFEFITDALSANDMSPDGRFIVGEIDQDGNGFPDGTYLLDRQTDTMTILPPQGLDVSAVSDDGTVVLGCMPDHTGVGSEVAAIWTEATGWQSLGFLPNAGACPSRSNGYELSADGSVAVGLSWDGCSGRGFVWTAATGMQELQVLANGGNRASVVSADGTLIGGFAQSATRTPAMWNGGTLAGELLDPPNGDTVGEVYGLRDDGSVLLVAWGDDAATWTADDGIQIIGNGSLLAAFRGVPQDIADNGTIVGFDILLGNRRAWIQPEGAGPIIDMYQYVVNNGGTMPSPSYNPQVCSAISADGTIIIGHGGLEGAWLVTIEDGCFADWNGDDTVDSGDFFDFIGDFISGDADIDGSGTTDSGDFFDFIGAFVEGC